MNNEESMALCAIRYCIGRSSYIVPDGVAWAREWGAKSEWVRSVLIQDLEPLANRHNANPDGRMRWLGDAESTKQWLAVLAELRAMPTTEDDKP